MILGDKFYGFIGFGHMAETLLSSWLKTKLIQPSEVFFIRRDIQKQKETSKKFGISGTSLRHLVETCDVIFFCVRPQNIQEVIDEFPKNIDLSYKCFISILAGTPLAYFHKALGGHAQIMRVMPNLPSKIGEGMNALTFGKDIDPDYIHLAKSLFSCLGEIEEVPEKAMDLVTSLSGSGPAFIASLIHAMASFGKDEGLSYEKALKIACQTLIGTAKLVQINQNPEQLIREIVVPGGTTEAGLNAMKENHLLKHFVQVFQAAFIKAKSLS